MDNVFTQLAKMHTDVRFVKVDAEAVPEVSLRYELAVVPTFVFLLVCSQAKCLRCDHLDSHTHTHAHTQTHTHRLASC